MGGEMSGPLTSDDLTGQAPQVNGGDAVSSEEEPPAVDFIAGSHIPSYMARHSKPAQSPHRAPFRASVSLRDANAWLELPQRHLPASGGETQPCAPAVAVLAFVAKVLGMRQLERDRTPIVRSLSSWRRNTRFARVFGQNRQVTCHRSWRIRRTGIWTSSDDELASVVLGESLLAYVYRISGVVREGLGAFRLRVVARVGAKPMVGCEGVVGTATRAELRTRIPSFTRAVMSRRAVSWEHLASFAHFEVVSLPSKPSRSRLRTLPTLPHIERDAFDLLPEASFGEHRCQGGLGSVDGSAEAR